MFEQERNLTKENIRRVRKLRSEMGVSEKRLWEWLRNEKLGFKFRRQHPIGLYVLDFYCPKLRLCVEVDGEQHELRRDKDARRDQYLLEKGIVTIRIPSMQLFGEDEMTAIQWAFKLEEICVARAEELIFPKREQ